MFLVFFLFFCVYATTERRKKNITHQKPPKPTSKRYKAPTLRLNHQRHRTTANSQFNCSQNIRNMVSRRLNPSRTGSVVHYEARRSKLRHSFKSISQRERASHCHFTRCQQQNCNFQLSFSSTSY